MAAPAGGGGSAVSVLAPNGRRHTVKVTPSTVLLQVLEDVCRRQDFNPGEYGLKFQRSALDLSLQWRFANLPNNARLEMVRVALQLQDGPRLQGTFGAGQTLWELLSHFAQTRERLEPPPAGATPACVYMRDEVAGRAALQGTTLQALGLTGGSATIRFTMKPGGCAGQPEPGGHGPRSGAPGGPAPSLPAGEAADGPALPLGTDVSREQAAGAPRGDPGPGPAAPSPTPAAFVPFSGGGRRLGGPLAPGRPPTSPMARSATSPTPLSSPGGPSQPKKLRPGQEPLPVERGALVCHPDLEELLRALPAELPDEFFEVTVDDVRRRLAQLKSERQRLEEAPLVTKAFREAQAKEKLERYPKVALRVLFPDRYILQGFFRPGETVGDLRAFVRSHLGNPDLPFYLFIAPPRTLLDDPSLTLFQANLFPAALVHFGAEEPTGLYLAPRLLEHPVAPSAADLLVARCMSRAAPATAPAAPEPEPEPEREPEREPEPAAEEGAAGAPEPRPGLAQPPRRDPGKVPKWLRLPASRR